MVYGRNKNKKFVVSLYTSFNVAGADAIQLKVDLKRVNNEFMTACVYKRQG